MTALPRWQCGPLQRSTRNLLLPLDIGRHRLLAKYTRNREEARAEIRGHAHLAPHYRVPALHARIPAPGGYLLLYQRLSSETDRGLLLDLLNQPASDQLTAYMSELTTSYRKTIAATARPAPASEVVRKLYWDRAADGGRLDRYYKDADFPVADGLINLPVCALGNYTLEVNGHRIHFDWAATLAWVKKHFATPGPIWAALTQGDPTDVNLAHPLAWFDYDTAGMNSILGEFANFLWYTTVLGGWLVPTYNPAAFVKHPATFTQQAANTPVLHQVGLERPSRTLRVGYTARLTPARRTAAALYWRHLVQPVAAQLWPHADLAQLLRPYWVMRILGVYNLADLAPQDRLILLIRLAEAMSPTFNPAAWFAPTETACPAR